MSDPPRIPYDKKLILEQVREFFERLIAEHAALEGAASLRPVGSGAFDVWVELRSPTGDPARTLRIWSHGADIGIGYGGWHTHPELLPDADPSDPALATIGLLAAVFNDQLVLVEEKGEMDGQPVNDTFGLDLRDPDALLEFQTDPHRLESARILSWTGSRDQRL